MEEESVEEDIWRYKGGRIMEEEHKQRITRTTCTSKDKCIADVAKAKPIRVCALVA